MTKLTKEKVENLMQEISDFAQFQGDNELEDFEWAGVTLKRTCFACPEQYDAYFNSTMIGYFRLRHGTFTVEYPDCGGKLVYKSRTIGDGIFDKSERRFELMQGIYHLLIAVVEDKNEPACLKEKS